MLSLNVQVVAGVHFIHQSICDTKMRGFHVFDVAAPISWH